MSAPLRIALAGLGTIGAGTLALLRDNAEPIARRAGRQLEVVAVSARDRKRDRGVDLAGIAWHDDAAALAALPDIDVVVELIGGSEGVARALRSRRRSRMASMSSPPTRRCWRITARSWRERAEARGVALGFEAAVAGGIPIIKVLREGLAANQIERIYGILNGTCNYILTQMRDERPRLRRGAGRGAASRLCRGRSELRHRRHRHRAQAGAARRGRVRQRGRSRRHPCRRHSPCLRARTSNTRRSSATRIKLLGVARPTDHGLEQRVHPCMVPQAAPIAHVEGVFNAVVVEGDAVGRLMLEGRGAGAEPTASAVVADLIDIAAGRGAPGFGVPASSLQAAKTAPMARHRGAYYMRLMVSTGPASSPTSPPPCATSSVDGADAAARPRAAGEAVPVVITTHETEEAAMLRARRDDRQAGHGARTALFDSRSRISDTREDRWPKKPRWTAC